MQFETAVTAFYHHFYHQMPVSFVNLVHIVSLWAVLNKCYHKMAQMLFERGVHLCNKCATNPINVPKCSEMYANCSQCAWLSCNCMIQEVAVSSEYSISWLMHYLSITWDSLITQIVKNCLWCLPTKFIAPCTSALCSMFHALSLLVCSTAWYKFMPMCESEYFPLLVQYIRILWLSEPV